MTCDPVKYRPTYQEFLPSDHELIPWYMYRKLSYRTLSSPDEISCLSMRLVIALLLAGALLGDALMIAPSAAPRCAMTSRAATSRMLFGGGGKEGEGGGGMGGMMETSMRLPALRALRDRARPRAVPSAAPHPHHAQLVAVSRHSGTGSVPALAEPNHAAQTARPTARTRSQKGAGGRCESQGVAGGAPGH